VLSAAERQQVVDQLVAIIMRYRLWVTEPTVARTANNFLAWLVRRWHVYPSE